MSSSNRPTHAAHVVVDPPEGSDCNAKARWHEVGAVWTRRDGDGFDVLITPGISITGRIFVRARREQTTD